MKQNNPAYHYGADDGGHSSGSDEDRNAVEVGPYPLTHKQELIGRSPGPL